MMRKFVKPRLPERRPAQLTDGQKTVARVKQDVQRIIQKYKSAAIGYVYLVIDCSGSMGAGNKMEQAKNGGIAFADDAHEKGYAVGLITFSRFAKLVLKPQRTLAELRTSMMRLKAETSTNLAPALKIATDQLRHKRGERVMCVVTDGMPQQPDAAIAEALMAREEGIDIITIGTEDADEDFLRRLSSRDELSIIVKDDQLEIGILTMAQRCLPHRVKDHPKEIGGRRR